MLQLIKKGGLRERANRSRQYLGSENTETTLKPNRYQDSATTRADTVKTDDALQQENSIVAKPQRENQE